ncbi:hypothetical protein H4R18_001558 [Coemansia javaensis]|uniref:SRP9 domain-containing protein n=1 Tax=Coemansia javaensis TaxID=2761396 RepID=A0A9W8HGW2_9FUNG|nr:hypothetical protein H4R18_001558 [Coemansia javaensis]
MVFHDSWDAFERAAADLFASAPDRARYSIKYRNCEAALVLKVTDDASVVQLRTTRLDDLRRIARLHRTLAGATSHRAGAVKELAPVFAKAAAPSDPAAHVRGGVGKQRPAQAKKKARKRSSSPPDDAAAAPPRRKARVLQRLHSTAAAATRRRASVVDPPGAGRYWSKSPRHQPRPGAPQPIYADLHESPDVWARKPARARSALRAARTRTLRRRRTAGPCRRRSARSSRSSAEYVVVPAPGAPVARSASARSPSTQRSSAVRMPTAADYAVDADAAHCPEEAPASPSQPGTPQPARASWIRSHWKRATAITAVTTASAATDDDEDRHSPRVFRVLGRANSHRSRKGPKADDSPAPALVTISNDGRIVNSARAAEAPGRIQTPPVHEAPSLATTRTFLGSRFSNRRSAHRRNQSDEVSDIAMRDHLVIGDDQPAAAAAAAAAAPVTPTAEAQSRLEQLQAQAGDLPVHGPRTISQVIAQLPVLADAAASTVAGPEQDGALDHVLQRVADLESRLAGIEALMASMEGRLALLTSDSPSTLRAVRPSKAKLVTGKTLADEGRGAPAHATVQAAAARLAEIVTRSKKQFDAAAASTLSSLAGILGPADHHQSPPAAAHPPE